MQLVLHLCCVSGVKRKGSVNAEGENKRQGRSVNIGGLSSVGGLGGLYGLGGEAGPAVRYDQGDVWWPGREEPLAELPRGDCFADSTPLGFNTSRIPHFKTQKKIPNSELSA